MALAVQMAATVQMAAMNQKQSMTAIFSVSSESSRVSFRTATKNVLVNKHHHRINYVG